ncbi:hypothetical protein [Xenorhabdus thuongxuanensis]|uniref:NgrE n=1 Tax=Xenorhabdus thuongxuanensis TaxID=1873484 RepID=A0A1Q5TLT1_9GAMM|nr:hypothetical protein [Xenorhabdus thuongxuanensis]OKP00306.1 NgrE [Xenorhabdus thuongxuanensis]OKP01149.1 NgrE [Xenorhabdus thuongxuanensis]
MNYDLKTSTDPNTRLEKNKNGADILDKPAFVKNLGLADAVKRAENAYPKTGGTITGHVDINASHGVLRLNAPERNSDIFVEFGSGNNRDAFIGFGSRDTKTFTIHNDKTNAKLQINEYATFNENKLLDMGDIASHTGSSPKTVMSQKSVTEAINRHASLGINQQWRDVTDNRRPSVAYKNNTDRPICISVTYQELVIRDWYALMALNINGRDIVYSGTSMSAHEGTIESRAFVTGVIPPGASYSLSMYTNHDITSGNLRWYELS